MALGRQSSIEFVGQEGLRGSDGASYRIPVGAIGLPPAQPTRAMPGGQRDRVIEKEDRRPPSGRSEREAPAAKLGDARDPERAPVVAHDSAAGIDEAPAVAGEKTPTAGGM